MDTETGDRKQEKWWNSGGMKALAASCALAFVLLTAYGYFAFPSQGIFNAELGVGGAVGLFIIGFAVFLMNEHAKSKRQAGRQVRF